VLIGGRASKALKDDDFPFAAVCKNFRARATSPRIAQKPDDLTHLATFSPFSGSSINRNTSLACGVQCWSRLDDHETSARSSCCVRCRTDTMCLWFRGRTPQPPGAPAAVFLANARTVSDIQSNQDLKSFSGSFPASALPFWHGLLGWPPCLAGPRADRLRRATGSENMSQGFVSIHVRRRAFGARRLWQQCW